MAQKPRFSVRTFFWLVTVLAAFWGGKATMMPSLKSEQQLYADLMRNSARLQREVSDLKLEYQFNSNAGLHRASAILKEHLPLAIVSPVPEVCDVWMSVPVRFTGVACPKNGQPFYAEAHQFGYDRFAFQKIILKGLGHDSEGRLLAEVRVDGRNVSRELLKAGLAWYDKRHGEDEELAELEAKARATKQGLWSDENPMPPWEWPTE